MQKCYSCLPASRPSPFPTVMTSLTLSSDWRGTVPVLLHKFHRWPRFNLSFLAPSFPHSSPYVFTSLPSPPPPIPSPPVPSSELGAETVWYFRGDPQVACMGVYIIITPITFIISLSLVFVLFCFIFCSFLFVCLFSFRKWVQFNVLIFYYWSEYCHIQRNIAKFAQKFSIKYILIEHWK